METFFDVLQKAVSAEDGVVAQRAVIVRSLAALNYRESPERRSCTFDGRPATLHVWLDTPAGDVALISGRVIPKSALQVAPGGVVKLYAPNDIALNPTPQPSSEGAPIPYSIQERVSKLDPKQQEKCQEAAARLRALLTLRYRRDEDLRRQQEAARAAQPPPRPRGRYAATPPRGSQGTRHTP